MAEELERALTLRKRVITIASTQIGQDDPSAYWQDVLGYVPPKTIAWCGAFVLWDLRLVFAVDWKWVPRLGFIYVDNDGNRLDVPRLPSVSVPSVGDIAYYDKPFQHYAFVESVETSEHNLTSRVHVIAGNTPDVSRFTENIRRASRYYSIAPLL